MSLELLHYGWNGELNSTTPSYMFKLFEACFCKIVRVEKVVRIFSFENIKANSLHKEKVVLHLN